MLLCRHPDSGLANLAGPCVKMSVKSIFALRDFNFKCNYVTVHLDKEARKEPTTILMRQGQIMKHLYYLNI